jgi:hypothetical protein
MRIVPDGLAEQFLDAWEKTTGERPHNINNGWCYQFALILYCIHGGKVRLCNTDQHAWIVFEGKHYDSDHPDGSAEPLDRGCFLEPTYMTMLEMEAHWNRHGIEGPVRWDIILGIAQLYTPMVKQGRRFIPKLKAFLRLKGLTNAKV